MQEEQRQILEMLKEGNISVDEAEKLINALKEGAKKRSAGNTGSTGSNKDNFGAVLDSIKDSILNIGPVISESLSSIGPIIGTTINEVLTNLNITGEGIDVSEMDPVDISSRRFEMEEGSELIVINKFLDKKEPAGNLALNGTDGTDCSFHTEDDTVVQVYRKDRRYYFFWDSGDVRILVPKTVNSINAHSLSGDIEVRDVSALMKLKIMKGKIDAQGLHRGFTLESMNGDILLRIDNDWSGNSSASSMMGNVTALCGEGNAVIFNCETFRGDIAVDEGLGVINSRTDFPFPRKTVSLGEREHSTLNLKTMNGNIDIKRGVE